jgi:hypothetical protein
MTATRTRPHDTTPDAHLFATRPYDLVKEFVVAIVVVGVLTLALAVVFSSPDRPAISLAGWAKAAPSDVVATAVGELAGTTTSASYGAPYNTASPGQKLGPLSLQKWGGVRIPVNSADDLVIAPLHALSGGDTALRAALTRWSSATPAKSLAWAQNYSTALSKAPGGAPARVPSGDYGPVPLLASRYLALARTGGLQSMLEGRSTFYVGDETKPLLLLSDGAYLESQARAEHLGGDQWGMMNETGNYPGQPWMWLYTFWYQVKPFSTSDNADALVWGLMMVLTALLVFVPFIPGLRSLPRHLRLHRLIWRNYR